MAEKREIEVAIVVSDVGGATDERAYEKVWCALVNLMEKYGWHMNGYIGPVRPDEAP